MKHREGENQESQPNAEQSQPEKERPVSQPPSVIDRKNSTCAEAEGQHEKPFRSFARWWHDPYRTRAGWTDKAVVLLTAGIVFLAFMQWKEMDDSGKQTDKIIGADNRIAAAMEGAVGQAQKSLDAAIEQNHLDQRAWVGVDSISGIPEGGKPWLLSIEFRNTGKTPARKVSNSVGTQELTVGKKPDYGLAFKAQTRASSGLIVPGGTEISNMYGNRPISSEEIAKYKLGITRMYIFGESRYMDIFDRTHTTKFCFYLRWANEQFVYTACEDHNDAT
jgi:hypothetical protein